MVLYIGKTSRDEVYICENPKVFALAYRINKNTADILRSEGNRVKNREAMQGFMEELNQYDIIPDYIEQK